MWVKICGITNLSDALCAVEAGADALGFVFYPHSPRYISPENALKIAALLPSNVLKIGLFVNVTPEEINEICKEAKMDIAQIHFEVDKPFLEALGVDYLCVVRAKTKEDVKQFCGKKRLVDAYVEGYGGAGQRLELSWFNDADRENIILAGGLNPANLEQITPLGFFGVDVSSGVEKTKGLKNHDLVREFVCKAKA